MCVYVCCCAKRRSQGGGRVLTADGDPASLYFRPALPNLIQARSGHFRQFPAGRLSVPFASEGRRCANGHFDPF